MEQAVLGITVAAQRRDRTSLPTDGSSDCRPARVLFQCFEIVKLLREKKRKRLSLAPHVLPDGISLDDELPVPEVVEDLARLDDARVYDAVEDVQSVAAGDDQAVMAHQSQVLGEVSLRQGGDLEQFLDRRLLFLQYIEHLEALRVRKYLIYQGVLVIRLLRKG